MVVEASITGLFRTILIIIGVIVLARFIGQLMNARRNMEEERRMNERTRKLDEERKRKQKNLGKVEILKKKVDDSDIEDANYEDIS